MSKLKFLEDFKKDVRESILKITKSEEIKDIFITTDDELEGYYIRLIGTKDSWHQFFGCPEKFTKEIPIMVNELKTEFCK